MEAAPPSTSARRHVHGDDDGFTGAAAGGEDDDEDCPDGHSRLGNSSGQLEDEATQSQAEPKASSFGDGVYRGVPSCFGLAEQLRRSRSRRREPGPDYGAVDRFAVPDIARETWEFRGSVAEPLRDILLSSWLNFLLVFVPIGLASYLAQANPVLVFASNAVAIVPLSALLTDATERIAAHAGDTVGALLNISLGNLVELIIFIVALAHNQVRIVQASILGSVLVNLLLILGSALLVGSTVNREPTLNTADAQLLACLLFVSVFAFLMPTAFGFTFEPTKANDALSLKLSRISSLLILAIYIVYLAHELRSRSHNPRSSKESDLECNLSAADRPQLPPPPLIAARLLDPKALSPRTIRLADGNAARPAGPTAYKANNTRIQIGALIPTDFEANDESFRGRGSAVSDIARSRPSSQQPLMPSRKYSRSLSLDSSVCRAVRRGFLRSNLTTLHMLRDGRLEHDCQLFGNESSVLRRHSIGGFVVPLSMLVVSSGLMSMSAELLVSAIDDVTRQTGLSGSAIGLIILPIVGNIAEYVTVVSVAARDKLDLAIAVSVGSSIQVALCVTPLTVIAGWIMGQDLALTFNFFEMATLLGGVLLVNLLILNESSSSLKTGALKGALMCACYVIIGLGAYFAP